MTATRTELLSGSPLTSTTGTIGRALPCLRRLTHGWIQWVFAGFARTPGDIIIGLQFESVCPSQKSLR